MKRPNTLDDILETTDGSRPDAISLDGKKATPVSAFQVLRGGDVFEGAVARVPTPAALESFLSAKVMIRVPEETPQHAKRVAADIRAVLARNTQLLTRAQSMKPIVIDVLGAGESYASVGLPPSMNAGVAGIFWHKRAWDHGRIALRADKLNELPTLAHHEFAHALHYLAFTEEERTLIYNLLRPTFGAQQYMDEVFALYSEREFAAFTEEESQERSIYGAIRAQWEDGQVFTRFIRKLYFPAKPLAGPGLGGPTAANWMNKLGGR